MQTEARQVHIRHRAGSIETRQNVPQLGRVLTGHTARVVILKETFQPFVANRPDHALP
jgi:hypothetical protein